MKMVKQLFLQKMNNLKKDKLDFLYQKLAIH